jgi:hypothetical protein
MCSPEQFSRLSDYIEGNLPAPDRAHVWRHLQDSPTAWADYETLFSLYTQAPKLAPPARREAWREALPHILALSRQAVPLKKRFYVLMMVALAFALLWGVQHRPQETNASEHPSLWRLEIPEAVQNRLEDKLRRANATESPSTHRGLINMHLTTPVCHANPVPRLQGTDQARYNGNVAR